MRLSKLRFRKSRSRKLARARPTVIAVAVLLVAAGFGGGWWGAHHVEAQKIAYTKGRSGPLKLRPAPPAPAALQAEVERLSKGYGEPAGIAVTDVAQGWTAQALGEETFPQQSVSKLWVALAVMQAVDDKRLSLEQTVLMGPEDRSVFYQPLASRIRAAQPLQITIAELLRHALIESDNSANDRLIREVGGPGVVTQTIADKGLRGLAVGGTERDVQTRTAGLEWKPEYGVTWIFKQARAALPDDVRDQALTTYLTNPPDGASPVGIVTALAALKRGELLSRASTDFMLGLMEEARTGQMRLKAAVEPGWTLAHKTGTGPDWRGASVGINDVGLLTAPDGRTFAVAVMIRQTRQGPTARHRLMQGVARAVEAYWRDTSHAPAQQQQAQARADALAGL
jgi:beta-lactamase class A